MHYKFGCRIANDDSQQNAGEVRWGEQRFRMRAFAVFFLSLSPRARLVFVALVLVLIYCATR